MSFARDFLRGDQTVPVRVEPQGGDRYRVRVGAAVHWFRAVPLAQGGVRLVPLDADGNANGPARTAYGAPGPLQSYQVRLDGHTWTLQPPARRGAGGSGGKADGKVRAPMTGTVTKLQCQPGDAVTADQTLVVLTAMKMEHKLCAGIAGTVQQVSAAEGGTADMGEVLVVVVPE